MSVFPSSLCLCLCLSVSMCVCVCVCFRVSLLSPLASLRSSPPTPTPPTHEPSPPTVPCSPRPTAPSSGGGGGGNGGEISNLRAVTAWIPLVPVDKGNGGLRFMSGSHKDSSIAQSAAAATPAPDMGVGDVSFHHVDVLHGSFPNASPQTREACSVMFAAAEPKSGNDVACKSRTGKDEADGGRQGGVGGAGGARQREVAKGVDLDRASRASDCPFREDAPGSPCAICACMLEKKVGRRSALSPCAAPLCPRHFGRRSILCLLSTLALDNAPTTPQPAPPVPSIQSTSEQCSTEEARTCIAKAEAFCAANPGEEGCMG